MNDMHTVDGRWGINPVTGEHDVLLGLREMCDYAASVYTSKYDAIEFGCWSTKEALYVRGYMEGKYPNVPFYTTAMTGTWI